MKKAILIGSAIMLLVSIAFGRSMLGLYRLGNYVTASTEAERLNGGAWPRNTDACTVCHGQRGSSKNQNYPALAGQPADYVIAQLRNFASGARINPNMQPLAMTLTDADIKAIAAYYARQPALKNEYVVADAALRAKGEQLVQNGGCAACHGTNLMGQGSYPRLAGQSFDYMLRQFAAFADGPRTEQSGTMKAISSGASPEDRKAMATYLATLDPAAK